MNEEIYTYNDFDISPPLLQTLEELTKEFSESIILKALLGDDIVGSVRVSCGLNCIYQKINC